MISAEDGDELDEAAQTYATDTTWSWVKWFKKKKKSSARVEKNTKAWITLKASCTRLCVSAFVQREHE